MLHFATSMRRKGNIHEVKSVITLSNLEDKSRDVIEHFKDMRKKLEHSVPTNYKAKYNINEDDLTVRIMVNRPGEAQRVIYQLEDAIKTAAMALKLK